MKDSVEKGNYSFVFKSERASPPVALVKEMLSIDPLMMEISKDTAAKNGKNHRSKITEESINMPNKQKRFDFN